MKKNYRFCDVITLLIMTMNNFRQSVISFEKCLWKVMLHDAMLHDAMFHNTMLLFVGMSP